jgi:hypothetical protein
MRHLLPLLLLFALLSGCAGSRLKRAQRIIAEHKAETPPDQQLTELVTQHPELVGKTVRTVVERDTVRVPGATVTVRIPAVSTEASDNALVDSLMRSAARQLHAKDSIAYALRLRAILAARPKLSRDTLVQVLGPLTVRSWVDRAGVPHSTVTSAPQKFGYEQLVIETGPLQPPALPMTTLERVWLWVKDAAGLIGVVLVLVGGIWLFYFIKRQRQRSQPTS